MDINAACVAIHMRSDANNLVTTASTTRLREQKETIRMIHNMLREEACSGHIEDLAHVLSADCLSDYLTNASAKPNALVNCVSTRVLKKP